jgi:hypothetical protein
VKRIPSVPAMIAAIAFLLHQHADLRVTPAYVRAALVGPGETGIAGALHLAAAERVPVAQRGALCTLLTAAESLLPPTSPARDLCGQLRRAFHAGTVAGFEAVARLLARIPGCAEIMREVDDEAA